MSEQQQTVHLDFDDLIPGPVTPTPEQPTNSTAHPEEPSQPSREQEKVEEAIDTAPKLNRAERLALRFVNRFAKDLVPKLIEAMQKAPGKAEGSAVAEVIPPVEDSPEFRRHQEDILEYTELRLLLDRADLDVGNAREIVSRSIEALKEQQPFVEDAREREQEARANVRSRLNKMRPYMDSLGGERLFAEDALNHPFDVLATLERVQTHALEERSSITGRLRNRVEDYKRGRRQGNQRDNRFYNVLGSVVGGESKVLATAETPTGDRVVEKAEIHGELLQRKVEYLMEGFSALGYRQNELMNQQFRLQRLNYLVEDDLLDLSEAISRANGILGQLVPVEERLQLNTDTLSEHYHMTEEEEQIFRPVREKLNEWKQLGDAENSSLDFTTPSAQTAESNGGAPSFQSLLDLEQDNQERD